MKEFINKYLKRNRNSRKDKVDDLLERVVRLEMDMAAYEALLEEIQTTVVELYRSNLNKPKKAKKPAAKKKVEKELSDTDLIIRKSKRGIENAIENAKKDGWKVISVCETEEAGAWAALVGK